MKKRKEIEHDSIRKTINFRIVMKDLEEYSLWPLCVRRIFFPLLKIFSEAGTLIFDFCSVSMKGDLLWGFFSEYYF